ncbi:MAG TPA: glycosyltransferase family 4 protein [Polyangia bacterium]|nr:glycosyltransferase family 4 protein [Polyangia bacterium]
MRVGVVTTSYPRDRGDFAGWFVAERVRALLAEAHDVDVLAGGAPDGAGRGERLTITRLPARFADGPDLFAGAGAPEVLEGGGAATFWAAARFSASLAAEIASRASRWDRVESHWLAPSALAVMAAAPGLPHRATAHSGDVALLERVPFGRSLARLLARSGAELAFVSEDLRRRFGALAGQTCGVVSPLARPPVEPAAPPPGASPGAGPVVVSVARLVPIKGLDVLVRACAPRPGDDAPLRLVVVGEGPERARLRRLADGLGVSLELVGAVPRDEVPAWLRLADVYAQPSRTLPNGRAEGMPLATLEALDAGVPVVASDSGGLAELRGRHPHMDVVPAGDAAALGTMLRARLAHRTAGRAHVTAV